MGWRCWLALTCCAIYSRRRLFGFGRGPVRPAERPLNAGYPLGQGLESVCESVDAGLQALPELINSSVHSQE